MTIDEIRRQAAALPWTRGQVHFLADRIRNALIVLRYEGTSPEDRAAALDKLQATIEAIERCTARKETLRAS